MQICVCSSFFFCCAKIVFAGSASTSFRTDFCYYLILLVNFDVYGSCLILSGRIVYILTMANLFLLNFVIALFFLK